MNRGKPTLKPWDEVGLESIGAEADLQHLQQADAAAVAMAGLKMADAPAEEAVAGLLEQPAAENGEAASTAAAGEEAEAAEPAVAGQPGSRAAEAPEPAEPAAAGQPGSGAVLPPPG